MFRTERLPFILLLAILMAPSMTHAQTVTGRLKERDLARSDESISPEEAVNRLVRAFDLCADNPYLTVRLWGGDNFLFDEDGCFLASVSCPYLKGCLLLSQGEGNDMLAARFADQEHDPELIGYGTRATLVRQDTIRSSLEREGAFEAANHGFFRGCRYLIKASHYGGQLDFAKNGRHGIAPNVFYLTQTVPEGLVAHNCFNYGNFLWGAAAREAGVPLWVARLGAHFNNFFLSPDTQGSFDAPDDQFSIAAGYHWR